MRAARSSASTRRSRPARERARPGNVGIGFAVPANTVKDVVAQILRTGRVDHAYLGISGPGRDRRRRRRLQPPCRAGCLVESVTSSSGADKAGLEGGKTQVVVAGETYVLGGDIIVCVRRQEDLLDRRAPRRDRRHEAGRQGHARDLPRREQDERDRHARTAARFPPGLAASTGPGVPGPCSPSSARGPTACPDPSRPSCWRRWPSPSGMASRKIPEGVRLAAASLRDARGSGRRDRSAPALRR